MLPTSTQLKEYLGPDEPLLAVSAGKISDNSSWRAVSIGITDRRLLYVSEDGGFANIGHDSISAIRSRPRTAHTYRGNDYRLLLGSGILVAILGFLGAVALTTGVFSLLLFLVSVGGLVSAEYLRRNPDGIEWATVVRIVERVPYDFNGRDGYQRYEYPVFDSVDEHRVLLIGSSAVAVASFVGTVALASSGLVILAGFAVVGGIALIDYALRHRNDFDGIEIVRRDETEVTISTDDGRTIYIRSDRPAEIDRELSRVAFRDEAEPNHVVSTPS